MVCKPLYRKVCNCCVCSLCNSSLRFFSFIFSGIAGKQYPHIMLFDITDGKAGIARIARELCEKALAKEITQDDVNKKYLSEIVLKEAGVPEPELGLYCGDICSTFGFLPWHSRVTEFL